MNSKKQSRVMIGKKAELKHISSHMPDRTDELLPALRKTKFLLPRSLFFRRQNSSVKSFLDWKIAKITNAPDVTLNDVTANINQRYSNSLLSPSGFYLFQAHSMRSASWVWREVKKREKKKEGDTRGPPPTLPSRNFSCSHLFAPSPQPELTPAIG